MVYQCFQRDAMPDAFSDDDWRFHSNARALLAPLGYSIDPTWSLQLTYMRGCHEEPFRNGSVEWLLCNIHAVW